MILYARNVNDALERGLALLRKVGTEDTSRNGRVLRAPTPVLSVYSHPGERVLFNELRDANPFFHLYEALWMLAGRNDVATVAYFASRMREYSDDGEVLHGAYGFRWREFFGVDQLQALVALLRQHPDTRRAVLTMWAPNGDLVASEGVGGTGMKDVPCNTQVYFAVRQGALDMTVTCRSNDIVWGAYGANYVHFSFLHAWVAGAVGLEQGRYYHFSNDFHAYPDAPGVSALLATPPVEDAPNPYTGLPAPTTYPLGVSPFREEEWLGAAEKFVEDPGSGRPGTFFGDIGTPMCTAYAYHKAGQTAEAHALLSMHHSRRSTYGNDWLRAGMQWLQRRGRKTAGQGAAK